MIIRLAGLLICFSILTVPPAARPAGYDRKHVLGIDYVFYMPRLARGWMNRSGFRGFMNGWQVSGVGRIWTGLPLTITSNGNTGTLGGGIHANYVGGDVYPA